MAQVPYIFGHAALHGDLPIPPSGLRLV